MKRSLFLICTLAAVLLTACSATDSGGETKSTEQRKMREHGRPIVKFVKRMFPGWG